MSSRLFSLDRFVVFFKKKSILQHGHYQPLTLAAHPAGAGAGGGGGGGGGGGDVGAPGEFGGLVSYFSSQHEDFEET